jgi:thiamine biosynthesis lipoprotein
METPALARHCTAIVMDTAISLRAPAAVPVGKFAALAEQAFGWFHTVERVCSRFDPNSEVMQLTKRAGEAVPVTPILFQAVQFALAVAELSAGAFDPTVGQTLEARGFNRHYVTGTRVSTALPDDGVPPCYTDVLLDDRRQTITLLRPLILDLGAVVKGLAIDLAAKELAPLGHFSIDAGGDLYVAGHNEAGDAWRVGVRHPRQQEAVAALLRVSDMAVCTSGDYERPAPAGGHHIVDPRSGHSPGAVASVTVVAPHAMLADALSTAVFVLGPEPGLRLLESQGLDGLLLSATLESWMTPGMECYLA